MDAFVDFVIQNGNGAEERYGDVANGLRDASDRLGQVRFETGLFKPYRRDSDNRKAVTVNTGRTKRVVVRTRSKTGQVVNRVRHVPERQEVLVKDLIENYDINLPVFNAVSLRKDQWIELDRAVVTAARQRLRAWNDLAAANPVTIPNGMGKTTYEYEAEDDTGEAVVDMDVLGEGRQQSPQTVLSSIPLPITHSDFYYSARRIAVSQSNGGQGVHLTSAERAGRRIAEMIEKTTIGVETGISYGPTAASDARYRNTSKVYGYTNYPYRLTKTDLTTPTGSNADDVFTDVIEMREQMYALGFYGPFVLYHTPAYSAYLDRFFTVGTAAQGLAAPSQSLRSVIEGIDGISAVRRLDYWTGSTYQMVMVQMTRSVAEALSGMDLTTVQWDTLGGMRKNYKVMCIKVPLLKTEYNGTSTGILHATTS